MGKVLLIESSGLTMNQRPIGTSPKMPMCLAIQALKSTCERVPNSVLIHTPKDATTNMPEGHMYNRPFSNETVTPSIPSRVVITLPIDADVLHWLQRQPAWPQEINDLCRAYMESHLIREMAFEEDGQ